MTEQRRHSATDSDWPELPSNKFVAGRAATEADVKRGHAIFLAYLGGVPSGRPAPIAIPQYGYLLGEDGLRTPVVVVQAEIAPQATLIGVRDAQGKEYVVTEPEVILLGTSRPS
jgi:hypothetical protein